MDITKGEFERIAAMNAPISALSDSDIIEECLRRIQRNGRLLLDREVFVGGLRYDPAAYVLHRAGLAPVGQDEHPF